MDSAIAPASESRDTDLQRMTYEERVRRAGFHIVAAYNSDPEPVEARQTTASRAFAVWIQRLRPVHWLAIGALVALSMLERPVWCYRMPKIQSSTDSQKAYACETDTYPGWTHHYMESDTAIVYEAICLSVLFLFEVGYTFAGGWGRLRPLKNKFKLLFVLLACADFGLAVYTPTSAWRLGPLLRIAIFASQSAGVRRELALFVTILPGLVSLLILVAMNLAFFGFIGLVLFHKVSPHYFGTFLKSMWQLLVLQTTSNWPDVMMEAYRYSRASYFFFLTFIIMSTFFVANLMVAVVYSKFTSCLEKYEDDALELTNKHLMSAYKLLDADGNGTLSKQEITAVVAQLKEAALLPDLHQDQASGDLLFGLLNTEADDKISQEEFKNLVTVLRVKWEQVETETYFQRTWPSLYRSSTFQAMRKAVISQYFQLGVDLTVLLMCVLTVWQALAAIHADDSSDHKETDGTIDSLWNVIEIAFTAVFVLEVVLKVIVFGWREYWHSMSNRLEFITAAACVLVATAVYIPNEFNDPTWIRYVASLRLLRMLRFLYVIVSFEYIQIYYETFLAMLPAAVRLFNATFCIVYFFSALGVMLFGGMVNKDPTKPEYAILSKMDYGTSDYWTCSFNDMPSGMVVMVQILVVNNWMVFVEAYGAIAGAPAWTLFISFYFIGVVIGLNILTSFVIDAFMGELEEDRMAEQQNIDGSPRDQDVPCCSRIFRSVQRARVVHVPGSRLTEESNDVAARQWRATVRGYETSGQKAQKVLKLLSMNTRNNGVSPGMQRLVNEAAHGLEGHRDINDLQQPLLARV